MKLHRWLFHKVYTRLDEANEKIKRLRQEKKALADLTQPYSGSINVAEDAMIKTWCLHETFHWYHKKLDHAKTLAEYHHYNDTRPSSFLLHIKDSKVTTVEKPAFPLDSNSEMIRGLYYRINLYQLFFQEVVDRLPKIADLLLLLEVGDEPLNSDIVPTYSFQKRPGDSTILVPDPDFIHYGFYEDAKYCDAVPYSQKSEKAVFVGSTSSTVNTVESVQARENLRIDAGLFFRETSLVDFRLPKLVQCMDAETEDLLRAMGFGQGGEVSWQDQFKYKFLISMDGNGATCSRVVISLKSQGVLLKYNSNSMLFYFSTLVPWLHYIPIISHKDVCNVVELEQTNPGYFETISNQARFFANSYLTKDVLIRYTGALLTQHLNMFVE